MKINHSEHFKETLKGQLDLLKKDLSQLVAINTVQDLNTSRQGQPFGQGIKEAFDWLENKAKTDGFECTNYSGYAMSIEYGHGEEILGILCHVDTVDIFEPDLWESDPFNLVERDGFWYGRGINDNKGPLLACYYLLKYLKESSYTPNKKIKLIIGGAEETTWACMDHYFKHAPMPDIGFSPDGNFPVVNLEMGIGYYKYSTQKQHKINPTYKENLEIPDHQIEKIETGNDRTWVCYELSVYVNTLDLGDLLGQLKYFDSVEDSNELTKLVYRGKPAPARHPEKGISAALLMYKDFKDISNLDWNFRELLTTLGSLYEHENKILATIQTQFGFDALATSNLSAIELTGSGSEIYFDYRYALDINAGVMHQTLNALGEKHGMSFEVQQHMNRHFVAQDSALIHAMRASYEEVEHKPLKTLTKGAASYARVMDNAVAFGPTFEGKITNSHKPNENIHIEDLIKALMIYLELIRKLT